MYVDGYRHKSYPLFKEEYEKVLTGGQRPLDVQFSLGISNTTYNDWREAYHLAHGYPTEINGKPVITINDYMNERSTMFKLEYEKVLIGEQQPIDAQRSLDICSRTYRIRSEEYHSKYGYPTIINGSL